MPAPKVEQPVTPAPEAPITLPNGIKMTNGPVKRKNDTFAPAAYEIAPGVIRIDR